VNRLRPEMVRALRNALACSVTTGKQHSMVVSPRGNLFAFGSNSHGQLGLGEGGQDLRYTFTPTVVEKLASFHVLQVACGSAHTLVICRCSVNDASSTFENFVYAMGLNSSGQLGLGHTRNVFTPTRLAPSSFCGEDAEPAAMVPSVVVSGPLAFHSFVLSDQVSLAPPALASVDMDMIHTFLKQCLDGKSVDSVRLKHFRERISASFSSISVLNSSFRRQLLRDILQSSNTSGGEPHSSYITAVGRHGLNLNLPQVREAYTSILGTENELVLATLGRATLAVSEQLKECPFDEAESLSVFLIVLENPLLLLPSKYHVVIQRVWRLNCI
jgi:hypothetical protein